MNTGSSQRPAGTANSSASSASSEGASSSSSLPWGPVSEPPASSSGIELPSVGDVSAASNITPEVVADNTRINWMGILSWAVIGLFFIVVLIVLLTNRRPPRGGSGRKRYRSPSRRKKGKHLLPDEYYRHLRY